MMPIHDIHMPVTKIMYTLFSLLLPISKQTPHCIALQPYIDDHLRFAERLINNSAFSVLPLAPGQSWPRSSLPSSWRLFVGLEAPAALSRESCTSAKDCASARSRRTARSFLRLLSSIRATR